MNCDLAAQLLAENKNLFASALLCAFDKSNGFTLQSLSYYLKGGKILPVTTDLTKVSELVTALSTDNTTTIRCDSNISVCIFVVRNKGMGDHLISQIRSFARLYNYMVMLTHNYRNYIAGSIYFHAKPREDSTYYPRFNSVEEVCETLSKVFDVRAKHFVYVGDREPKKLRIDADFLTYDCITVTKYCKREHLSSSFLQDLRSVIKFRQSRVGRLDTRGPFYAVFPVYDPNIRGKDVPPDGVVIVLSRQSPELFLVRASEEWLAAFSSKRHIQRASILPVCLAQAAAELHRLGYAATADQRLTSFSAVAQSLCKSLCSWTHAASVTIRMVDRARGRLTKIAAHQSPLGHYDERILEEGQEEHIPINMVADSFNAFAAAYSGSEKVLYLDEVKIIPTEYEKHGFKKILKHHPLTRTEAIARVVAGKSLVALINIEAPVSGCLRQHLDFFAECADFLGQLHHRLFSLADSFGLALMAKFYIEMHSTIHLIQEWQEHDADMAITIVKSLQESSTRSASTIQSNLMAFPAGDPIGTDVDKFNSGLRNWISILLSTRQSPIDVDDILIGSLPKKLDPSLIPSLFVIVSSIIENISSRPALTRNRVSFLDEALGFPLPRQLVVEWTSTLPFEFAGNRSSILLEPLVDAAGTHFGFFLIGVHARHQGGTIQFIDIVSKDGQATGFKLIVTLPYQPISCRTGKRVG